MMSAIVNVFYGAVCFFAPFVVALEWQNVVHQNESGNNANDVQARIADLIQRLADSSYANRVNAQSELERIGVIALDQLHVASFHPDPQIASIARYIVQSNQFKWAWDTDPVEVRQILSNYGSAPHSEKSTYIDQLQRLEHDQGVAALCRLVRYETQSSLAKRAAMLLLRGKPLVDQTLADRKKVLLNGLSGSQSQAGSWVLKYASQNDRFDLNWWKQVLASEKMLLEKRTGETNLELITDLNRWIVEQVIRIPELRSEALELARSLLTLGGNVKALDTIMGQEAVRADEFAQWALRLEMPELVQEQHAKLPFATVSRQSKFGYYLAESFLIQNKLELAEKVASRSLHQIACDASGEIRDQAADKNEALRTTLDTQFGRGTNVDLIRRRLIADSLKERGRFEWAEAEYRAALYRQFPKSKPARSGNNDEPIHDEVSESVAIDLTLDENHDVMIRLADMLHSLERYSAAANILEPFVVRFEKEPLFQKQLVNSSHRIEQILSAYYQYRGDEARESGSAQKAFAYFVKSFEYSSENVDAIIGLYKLDLTGPQAVSRRNLLKETVKTLRTQVQQCEEGWRSSNGNDHAYFVDQLAAACNALAWLMANTESHQEESLYLSQKACGLSPNIAEYYDTLAHCYAALGQFQNAVQQQRRALEIKPNHPNLRRALARFESHLQSADKP